MAKASDASDGEKKKKRGRQPAPTEMVIDPETGEVKEVKVPVVKHPIPDGWLLVPDFHTFISYYDHSTASVQAVYNWVKGVEPHTVKTRGGGTREIPSNGFPIQIHTDGRTIVNREMGIEWIANHEKAKSLREQDKANRAFNSSTRLQSSAAHLNMIFARQAANLRNAA